MIFSYIHNWTRCIELETLISKWDASIISDSSWLRSQFRRGGRESIRATRNVGHQGSKSRLTGIGAYMNSERLCQQAQAKWTQVPTSNSDVMLSLLDNQIQKKQWASCQGLCLFVLPFRSFGFICSF